MPKVGRFAKEDEDAMKSALVSGSILAEKGYFGHYITKELKLPRMET